MSSRTHRRVPPAGVRVTLRTGDGRAESSERVGHMSLGGVFVEMREPLAFGTDLAMEFRLPNARKTVRCKGYVVWTSRLESGPDGIGVRLLEIGITDMRLLAEHLGTEVKAVA